MLRAARHRERGQTIVMAALAIVGMVGALSMVVDTGIFFVVQRQFQAAADAGALAGAWHPPICLGAVGCYPGQAMPAGVGTPPVSQCPGTLPSPYAACDVAQVNANTVAQFCGGVAPRVTITTGTTLNLPKFVNVIVVTVECNAGYSFGRILGLTVTAISASSAAAIGDRNATPPNCNDGGDMGDFTSAPPPPPCGRIARLIE